MTPEPYVFDRDSLFYHIFFDYPLTSEEMVRWKVGKKYQVSSIKYQVENTNGYFFKKGRVDLVKKRIQRGEISAGKLKLAEKAAKILSFIPTIKMVAITGSLAMRNAEANSDIDLMIITKKGTLWLTRFIGLVCLIGRIRRSGSKNQKDKLCVNMWLDEDDLLWPKNDRNIYTAHEIAQIIHLVNIESTYEKLISKNRWILNYWPNAVKIKNCELRIENGKKEKSQDSFLVGLFERVAFFLQYQYMKPKITREVVTKTRAIFHPRDLGKKVLLNLHSPLDKSEDY